MHDTTPAAIRNRIKEFRNVPIGEIADNDRNWRSHPYAQENAMRGILQQVGIAGAALGTILGYGAAEFFRLLPL